ncbi:hypothetical protein AK812_SmicGene12815 [Symbiodinium microadriaticum]|uniref:Endonuclease/exonuclease/phosphatase domain-containing protein n=1 Tax=Symbiodinium microadriaticum TaxID=2951 RepID=A0A1Q9E9P5_SYMMI|nr:hypothetical protein AK812_SmicGene12815 [Symbiodinium microadriaticum]
MVSPGLSQHSADGLKNTGQDLLGLVQEALVSEMPKESEILSLVEKLEPTLDDGSLEHWVCHHILEGLSTTSFSREMWYVAVQAVQEVLKTSDPGAKRTLTCITANVTQWRREVATWLFELGPDVAAVQETHLGQDDIRQAQIEASKAGCQFQALPAGQGKGVGTLGGVAILTKNHLGARLVDSFVTKEGCGWIAVALRAHGRDLVLISLYLQSGVGPTGGCNPEVLAHLAGTLSQLQGVWVVMGDFNHPRQEMANLGWVSRVKGRLVGPACPTAGGTIAQPGVLEQVEDYQAWLSGATKGSLGPLYKVNNYHMLTLFIDLQGFYDGIRVTNADLWLDDISIDAVHRSPAVAAGAALSIFRQIKQDLDAEGLEVSSRKTHFVGTSSKAVAELKKAVIRCALAHGQEGRRLMLQAWQPLWQRQLHTRYGWQKVSGPLSALIQYLQDLGVDGQEPLCWKWDGHTLDIAIDDPCLLGKVRAFLAKVVAAWRARRFSKAQSASGAEEGVDWTVARRLLRADKLPVRRSSYKMVFQGLHLHEGNSGLPFCQWCGKRNTPQHLLYDCDKLPGAKSAPKWLLDYRSKVPDDCLWQRGMLPKKYVHSTAEHALYRDGIFAEEKPAWGRFVYATDASGGRYTKDPRLRHVGWAVIAATHGPQGLTKVGTLSEVLMNSTVSAGESEAIISLLKLVDEEVDVTTDSRAAMKHLQSASFTKNMYLSWGPVRPNRHLARATWIRSHTSTEGFAKEFGSHQNWRRTLNDWADSEAGRRANAAQPLSRAVKMQYLDRVVAHVIHHLAQRVQAALDHTDKDLVKKTIAKRRQQTREQAASPATGPNKKQRMQAKVDSPPEVDGHQWEVKEFKTNFTMKCKICQLYIESCKTGAHMARSASVSHHAQQRPILLLGPLRNPGGQPLAQAYSSLAPWAMFVRGQVEGARPAGMEQQSPDGDPECQGQGIAATGRQLFLQFRSTGASEGSAPEGWNWSMDWEAYATVKAIPGIARGLDLDLHPDLGEEPSVPLRLRPNVKTELEDEVHAAAAEIAAGDPIEVSDEENDWNQLDAEPLTGPQPSKRPESEIPAWGMARQNRRRPTEDHRWMPPQITAYRTSAGVLLKQPVTLQSLNKGQSRIVYSISSAIVMKITSRLQEHGEEHSFSLQFGAFCTKVLGLRTLRTELVHNGQTTVYQFPALFQERVFRLTQWLERWGSSLEGVEKTALGYYLLGLLGSIMLSKVRPRDYGSTNLGVRSLDQRACELVLYDLASWSRESDVYRARLNINPTFEWLERALGHSFHMHLRVYQDMHSRPEELVPFCLSQCDLFREHAERQFGAHLTIP